VDLHHLDGHDRGLAEVGFPRWNSTSDGRLMDLWPMHRAPGAPTFAVATVGEERGPGKAT
jgi:hypothetical protein